MFSGEPSAGNVAQGHLINRTAVNANPPYNSWSINENWEVWDNLQFWCNNMSNSSFRRLVNQFYQNPQMNTVKK